MTLEQRDVCKDGFGIEAIADAGVLVMYFLCNNVYCACVNFAVFLDLPRPWEAIETAKAAIKVGSAGSHLS